MSATKLNLEEDPRAQAVLALLLVRRYCATVRGRSPQEVAVGWPLLQEVTGADAACLGSLLTAGLVEAVDGAPPAQEPQSRFVITEAGCRLAYRVVAAPIGPRLAIRTCHRPPAAGERPCWDRAARELRFAGEVVLRFRRGARNQERLLDAFEELGWPPEIDDPLPHHRRVKPGERLRDTVKHLNAHLDGGLLHFRVNAEGSAVFWSAYGS
jgi:hypothetical protein